MPEERMKLTKIYFEKAAGYTRAVLQFNDNSEFTLAVDRFEAVVEYLKDNPIVLLPRDIEAINGNGKTT